MSGREEFAEIPAALVEATKVKLAGAVCKLVARTEQEADATSYAARLTRDLGW